MSILIGMNGQLDAMSGVNKAFAAFVLVVNVGFMVWLLIHLWRNR